MAKLNKQGIPISIKARPGLYSLWVRRTCGLAVYSLRSPCSPLLPVWGVDRARHTVPPPPGRLALPTPPTGTHRTRVRAGLLLLRAAVHSTAGPLLPSPPHTNSISFPL